MRNEPFSAAGPYQDVGIGDAFECALRTDGDIDCWGGGPRSATTGAPLADLTPPPGPWTSLAVGTGQACASDHGDWTCWGIEERGLLPVPNVPLDAMSIGMNVACGIDATQELLCWGEEASVATAAPSGPWRQVDAGLNVACATNTAGEPTCWGADDYGLTKVPN